MSAFRLLSIAAEAHGFARRFDSPMVGRDRQLATLERTFESAVADRAPHLFTILGAAGVGKSRLTQEFLARVQGNATVLRGRCLSYGEGITFWPVVEMLRQAAAIEEADPPDAIRGKLRSLLEGDPEADRLTDRLADVMGVSGAAAVPDETFWAVRRLLEALAAERPVVFVIDDLHWAEPTLFDLVEHVADWSREAPILLLCPARPELLDVRQGWGGGKLNATVILLEPLSEPESEDLIGNLLGWAEIAEQLRANIVAAAEGNPLFVEEMLAMLVDEGRLVQDDGTWVFAGDLSTVSVPPTMHALLAARLDRLGSEERQAIGCASVEGNVFHLGAVLELAAPEAPGQRVRSGVMALMRKELIRPAAPELPGQEAFRFRHQLVRDTAYESLPKERRAGLHERFAAWLEGAAGERAAEFEEILGYHLEQAYRLREELGPVAKDKRALAHRAASLLATAGRRARTRGDAAAAANLLRRATSLSDSEVPDRPTLLLDLGDALKEAGDLTGARSSFADAVEAAQGSGDLAVEAMAGLALVEIRLSTDPGAGVDDLHRTAAEAILKFEELRDDRGLARAWRAMGEVHNYRLDADAMIDALVRAIEHARKVGDRSTESDAAWWLLSAIVTGPDPIEQELGRHATLLEEVSRHRKVESAILVGRGLAAAHRGRFDEGRALMVAGRAIPLDLGLTIWWAALALPAGLLELMAQAPDLAEAELSAGARTLESVGETGIYSTTMGLLSIALYRQGRWKDAEAAARACREAANPEDLMSQELWRVTDAGVCANRGEEQGALRMAGEAFDLLRKSQMIFAEGEALLDLGEVFRHVGREQEARAAVEEALSSSKRKGNVVTARKARAALAKFPD